MIRERGRAVADEDGHRLLAARRAQVSFVMGVNFITASIIVLIIWLCWLFGAWSTVNNHWFERREYFAEAAQCSHGEWDADYVGVADDGRAPRAHVVHVLVAIHVPLTRTLGALHKCANGGTAVRVNGKQPQSTRGAYRGFLVVTGGHVEQLGKRGSLLPQCLLSTR